MNEASLVYLLLLIILMIMLMLVNLVVPVNIVSLRNMAILVNLRNLVIFVIRGHPSRFPCCISFLFVTLIFVMKY